MASSSSSSFLIPSLSFKSWNHDVFLSFRGEDTRKTFVDHLYTALKQKGIHTYKDDETLPRGESIGPSLLKAIRESRIAVIIFSKNFADSSWCLDELAYIMECKDTRGQIVMPVFYDVDPSDVRKQTGKYGKDIANKHELENHHKLDSWRKALAIAGNLSGWVPKDTANGHEAKCIKKIVRTISRRLSLLCSYVNTELIGIETRLEDLKSKLKIGSGGVRFVGIWGLGGSGKTTLASFAYEKISIHFEAHFFLKNIRDESRKHGLEKLQEKILSSLNIEVKLHSEENGKCVIKSRLGDKNVLIVLDDVNDLKQLEALAGSHDWFGEGSRVIITTRDEHLLTREADEIYGVSLLSQDEAVKLFKRHAYQEDKPVEDYESLSLDVVSYAGGLPLALKVLGSSLYDKDKDEWMSALAKLRDIPNPEIMDILKISYNGLQSDEKELFLDIACFLRRWPLHRAKMVLDACNFHTDVGVKVLVQKSLINVSNGIFDMHDLIEEMAHYIVIGEPPIYPERRSRVWRVEDVLHNDKTMENNDTKVVVLPPRLPSEVSYMTSLSVLGIPLKLSLPSHITDPCLPRVVGNMNKLRGIYWEGYPESSLPTNFQPINLGCLKGHQKQLWRGWKDVLTEEKGHVRLITLNQPRKLNVISAKVVYLLAQNFEKWEKDEDAKLIIIKGAGRAFSAGGDLKMFYEGRTSKDSCLEVVYRFYWLCYHIHTYKKPQVALVHGISMGGGASLMVPTKFSVVTEKTVFATPEASIGFHTDCGFSYILSRLPGHLGEYFGLTGARLSGSELVAAGLATHLVPLDKLSALENELISLNSDDENALKTAIEGFSLDVRISQSSVLNEQSIIDECFSKDSTEEILESFEAESRKEGNAWIVPVLKGLKRSSPIGLKITLKSIRDGRKQTLSECLKKEFRLTINILRKMISGDVYEGIRALTIDKDNSPKWDPLTLGEIDSEKLDLVFQSFEEALELKIPENEEHRWSGKYEDSVYT